MGMGWFAEDEEKLTMPEILSYPASPHLATKLMGVKLIWIKFMLRLKNWLDVMMQCC